MEHFVLIPRTISLNSKTPDEQDKARLTSLSFEKKSISDVERKAKIKKGISAIIGGILMFVIGFLMHRFLPLIAIELGGGLLALLLVLGGVLGILLMVISLPVGLLIAIKDFLSILSDPRGKNPQAALDNYIRRVLLGDESGSLDDQSAEYAYQVLNRMLPDSLLPERMGFVSYIASFRNKILDIFKVDYEKAFNEKAGNRYIGSLSTVINYLGSEAISQGIEKHMAEINLYQTIRYAENVSEKEKDITYSHIKMTMTMTLAQSGKYWYVYDATPMQGEAKVL
ncbi:MAG: hypothetical protein FWD03_03810 [Defluviitaleaceae bacterium]|nr:hypothetical protein [Defluviitaleaceae bacterium]